MLSRFLKDESGVTLMEYALIGAFIFCVIAASIAGIGPKLMVPFQSMDNGIKAALGP